MNFTDEGKLVFVRVPKTGSSSAFDTLIQRYPDFKRERSGHTVYRNFTPDQEARCDGFRRIGFVRHPLKWLTSMWSLYLRGGAWMHWGADVMPEAGQLKKPQEFLRALKATPMDWLVDRDGNLAMDTVYRTEDMAAFCKEFGSEPRWVNATRDRFTQDEIEWSDADLDYIKRRFNRELSYYSEDGH